MASDWRVAFLISGVAIAVCWTLAGLFLLNP
jgi:hypothetical protein